MGLEHSTREMVRRSIHHEIMNLLLIVEIQIGNYDSAIENGSGNKPKGHANNVKKINELIDAARSQIESINEKLTPGSASPSDDTVNTIIDRSGLKSTLAGLKDEIRNVMPSRSALSDEVRSYIEKAHRIALRTQGALRAVKQLYELEDTEQRKSAAQLQTILDDLRGSRERRDSLEIVPSRIGGVQCHKDEIFVAINNLVRNAFEHRRPDVDARVKVSGSLMTEAEMVSKIARASSKMQSPSKTRRWVLVTVSDNGRGIPANRRSAVFQLEVRLDAAGDPLPVEDQDDDQEREVKGMGLATTKLVAERHGGHVFLEDNEHHGTDAILAIPYDDPPG